ncbi:hypothetical protein BS78_02G238100 [Paspalum vaginatum]|nr:hypothetical protein BS78_02G238100 [Paspalum vaginatum]
MQSLSHCTSLEIVIDKHIYYQLTAVSTMSIYKTPVLLKKAVTVFKNKTDTLRTKVLVLASLRKTAMLRAISHRIHALVSSSSDREKQQARLEYHGDKALALLEATVVGGQGHGHGGGVDDVVDLSEVAMFGEDDHGYPDWTHSLFDDDESYCNDNAGGDEGHDDDHDETSVLDIIRSNREVEGLEFNADDEIDQACDLFIKRFRKRMNMSF